MPRRRTKPNSLLQVPLMILPGDSTPEPDDTPVRRSAREYHEQRELMLMRGRYLAQEPLLGLLNGSANGEKREKVQNPKTGRWYCPSGQRLQALGVIKGWPDVEWPIARRGYGGLFIEMKAPGEDARPEQVKLHDLLRSAGNLVEVHDSYVTAWNLVVWYGGLDPDWAIPL